MMQPINYDDAVAAYRKSSSYLDRFRDVVLEVLDMDDNPGDDIMLDKLREHFGKTGPESTKWRDRLVGYEAEIKEINERLRMRR